MRNAGETKATPGTDAILSAIATLLRPSGVAVITVPNDPLIGRLKRLARRALGTRWVEQKADWGGDEFHLHEWTPSEFEKVLGRHLVVTRRRGAPFGLLPVRACYRCVVSPEGR